MKTLTTTSSVSRLLSLASQRLVVSESLSQLEQRQLERSSIGFEKPGGTGSI
jgi:hypothetical protein